MSFERQQFTFYRSFLRTAEELQPKSLNEFLLALIHYALDEKEPGKMSVSAKASFEAVRPTLDSARRKARSGKMGGEAPRATRSKPKAERSKMKQNEANAKQEIDIEQEIDIDIGGEIGDCFPAEPENKEQIASPQDLRVYDFPNVFEMLFRNGVFMSDKDSQDCERLCAEYGSRAVIQAIQRAKEQDAPRWPYIRAIITSGGVGGRASGGRGGYQQHGDGISPKMQEAVDRMLAQMEEAPEDEAVDRGAHCAPLQAEEADNE